MHLIGVDPGKASGLAVLETSSMTIEHLSIAYSNCEGLAQQVSLLGYDFRSAGGDSPVVCENFIPRFGQKFDLDSVYHIGALQAVIGTTDVHLVLPATHKGLVPKEKLTALMKSQGYKVGAGHSRDALSVAVYYAAFVLREPRVLEFLADNKQEEK